MIRKWFSILALIAAATFLFSLSSCAFNSHLESIQVQPTSGTFGATDPTLFFQFKAFGSYSHPQRTVDITDRVEWQSDNPQVVQVTNTGVVSPSPDRGCGLANILATLQDGNNDVLSNSAAVTVDGNGPGCTPAGTPPTLAVNFSGTATGTVISSPPGIDCSSPSSCNAEFTAGTTVTLTGTPTGTSTLVTWNGCNASAGFTCTVIVENSVTVTATFQ